MIGDDVRFSGGGVTRPGDTFTVPIGALNAAEVALPPQCETSLIRYGRVKPCPHLAEWRVIASCPREHTTTTLLCDECLRDALDGDILCGGCLRTGRREPGTVVATEWRH